MLTKFSLILFLSLSYILYVKSVDVKTTSGTVTGKVLNVLNKKINQFLNIPYAEPPIGKLRFSKPVPLNQPTAHIDGTKTGHSCMQFDHRTSTLVQSEDCLYLNVWSPESHNSSDLKPIMLFIHGGGLHSGSSVGIDGSVLATFGVILVTINYRLGPFGFLYGGDKSAPGNAGFFDQNLAIKWVKENAHSFGGNPNEITIFGESAGSWSVSAQVLSPLSKGLFKRAILESGSVYNNKKIPNLQKSSALTQAKDDALHFNCSGAQWLDCLRKVTSHDLNDWHKVSNYAVFGTEFLPELPEEAFKAQTYSTDIDLMAGVMLNEGSTLALSYPKCKNLKSVDEFKALVKVLPFPELNADKIAEFYVKNASETNSEALMEDFFALYGDVYITCPTYHFAKHFAQSSPKRDVFFFLWTYPISNPIYGVSHGSELKFVFGEPVLKNTADKKFSEDTMKIWTNFAKNGKPMDGFAADVHWPRMIENTDPNKTRIKEMNPKQTNHIIDNYFEKSCDGFWKDYYV